MSDPVAVSATIGAAEDGAKRTLAWSEAPVPSLLFLAALAVVTVVYTTGPTNGRGILSFAIISLSSSAAVVAGVRRYHPSARLAWGLIASAPVLGCVGMTVRLSVTTDSMAISLVPDLITVPGYLLLLAGMLRLLRARHGAAGGVALDAGLMAVAALLLSWSLLIAPTFHTAMPVALKLVNVAYPTISVAILFAAVLLASEEVTHLPAFWCLGVAWVALLTGDVNYALAAIGNPSLPLWVANTAYCAFYALLGAAALHPSMVGLTRASARRDRPYSHSRYVAVAVALVLPAAVVALRGTSAGPERVVDAALLAVLGALVFVRMARAVNRHAQSESRLERLAHHDALTGMPNRLQLEGHLGTVLAEARTGGHGVGVIFIDLDAFKNVNDNWGHETGDTLLKVVAGRLQESLAPGQFAARVGGDEFLIVCSPLRSADDAAVVARRMLAVLEDTVSLGGYDLSVGASAGLAFGQPSELEVTASDLLREADTAMYRSKVQRRHAPVLFDESMRVEVADRIELETALRGALERDELELHYQPVVNLGDGVVCGFEALMRWQHPRLGQVAPDRFIPIAEDNGLILKLGRWAIREAARQLAAWRREYGGDLSMSVNLSAHQMHDPELTATVADALAATGIPPRALCLEITERTLMDDLKTTVATLQVLKQLGVQLSADDFGTGYSSLAYLRRFPFDEVKVDRAFVHGLAEGKGADVIVGAVVSMARALSLTTVAEGVETEEQRAHLLGLGATRGQGHLFSPPCSAETIEGRLGRDRWAQAGTGG